MHYSRSTSPLPLPVNHNRDCMSAATKRWKYMRRMFKFDQMDFEFAFWQMFYLFISPQRVYKNFQYRKQTKAQFARDDPAFLVLFALWLCVTSIGFAIALRLTFFKFLYFLLYVVFIDCIGTGLVIATIFWYVLNKYFRVNEHEDIEWGFAFDVHLNAFFPPLTLIHFCQLFFYNDLFSYSHEWTISRYIGNTFWLTAAVYYVYITFLGYSSLNNVRRIHLLLAMIPVILFCYVVSLSAGFNITYFLMKFYKERII